MRKPIPQFLDLLAACSPGVAHLALALRERVLTEAPDAVEKIFRNHPSAIWFGFGPNQEGPQPEVKMRDMFCYIAIAASHVNLGFCRGASLSDPDRVLEGAGKVMRHVKFWNERDVQRPFVRRYLRAAVDHARAATAKAPRKE